MEQNQTNFSEEKIREENLKEKNLAEASQKYLEGESFKKFTQE